MTAISPRLDLALASPEAAPAVAPPRFEQVYEATFDFVWRSLRRLGVPEAALDDAAQDVFVVVHRRLPEFAGRSSLKTWVFGIAQHVASDHRRLLRRKGGHEQLDPTMPDAAPDPAELTARAEAVRELDRVLAALDEDKRAVFILAELEQLTAPEIAEAVGVPLNTVYSRLRAARRAFEAALSALPGGLPR
jgi:RNA polymerase sigma-70 factor (ECF subfamily)